MKVNPKTIGRNPFATREPACCEIVTITTDVLLATSDRLELSLYCTRPEDYNCSQAHLDTAAIAPWVVVPHGR